MAATFPNAVVLVRNSVGHVHWKNTEIIPEYHCPEKLNWLFQVKEESLELAFLKWGIYI